MDRGWKISPINLEWDFSIISSCTKSMINSLKKNRIAELKDFNKKILLNDVKQLNILSRLFTQGSEFNIESENKELFHRFLKKMCSQGFLKPSNDDFNEVIKDDYLNRALFNELFNEVYNNKPLIPKYFNVTGKSKKITFSFHELKDKIEGNPRTFIYLLAKELDLFVASVSYYEMNYDEYVEKGLKKEKSFKLIKDIKGIDKEKRKFIFLGVLNTLTGFKGNKLGMELYTRTLMRIALSRKYIGFETGELSISSSSFMETHHIFPPINYDRVFKTRFMKDNFGKEIKTYFYPMPLAIKELKKK